MGLVALYCGANFGGAIAAILLRTPGDAPAAATVLDGYEMTRKGEAARALGIGIAASSLGGIFGCLVMLALTPQLIKIALQFGPAEYFSLAACGLTVIAGIGSKNRLKGIISGLLGLFLATVGFGNITSLPRFTLGIRALSGGIQLVPAVIGLFAVTEVFNRIGSAKQFATQKSNVQLSAIVEILRHKWTFFRSCLIGTWLGILPGIGSTTAAFVSYNEAVRWSKNSEKFGTGIPEGVVATEAANNAAVGGALIPLLALGIPGSSGAALVLGGFMIHGLRPGPLLMMQQPEYLYSILFGMILANILIIVGGMFVAKYFVQFLKIPYSIAGPSILMLCVIGIFSVRNSMADVWIMLAFGLFGFYLRKYDFPLTPIILGLVLGPIAEASLRRAMLISDNDPLFLVQRPISALLLVLALLSLVVPLSKDYSPRIKEIFRK
jgi:putative tricarboxylic transport membrane protein